MPRGTKDPRQAAATLPRTLQRSDRHAQKIWLETHDSAVRTYGEGRRAYMVAYAALKHSYEKRGDRWVAKAEKGPSDPQAARGPKAKPASTASKPAPTAGGKAARNEREARDESRRARRGYERDRWERIAKGTW
jgi:cation transport regulator ChaB